MWVGGTRKLRKKLSFISNEIVVGQINPESFLKAVK